MLCAVPNANALAARTVKQLQEMLRAKGLPVSGRKAALIDRLLEASPASTAAKTPVAKAVTPPVVATPKAAPPAPKAAPVPKAASVTVELPDPVELPAPVAKPAPKPPPVRAATPPPAPPAPAAKPASADVIAADPTPRRTVDASVPTLRVGSWNVAGLRALLRGDVGRASLRHLVDKEGLDVLMLQETKLQEHHVPEAETDLLGLLDEASGEASDDSWRAAWACSTARKGYSGVCTLWNARSIDGAARQATCMPFSVDPTNEAEREGRTLMLNLPLKEAIEGGVTAVPVPPPSLGIVNVYTPNSGAGLARLEYRVGADGWDERFRVALSGRTNVCVGGDLNVAVEDIDFFNPAEKRMASQAGTTPQERESMRRYGKPPLALTDAFRQVHPTAKGAYSYWSQRAVNRPRNRGLRLDYFLLSSPLAAALVDVQILKEVYGSDHAPVVMTLRLDELDM